MPSLTDSLAALREKYGSMLKPEFSEKMDRHIDDLRKSGAVARALKTGDAAPAFVLRDHTDAEVSSTDLLARGPLVVSFYRGTWCPYCNIELLALKDAYPAIKAQGAELVIVSPQSVADAADFVAEHPLPFPILIDENAKTAERFHLAYEFPGYLRDLYANVFANDLAVKNAGGTWRLPIPGRFVIDTDGTILDAQVDSDYRFRPEPSTAVDVLAARRTARV